MGYLLRQARLNRWDTTEERVNISPETLIADPAADFNVASGELSVWRVDNNIERLIAALAANRDKPDTFDYILFQEEILIQIGAEYKTSPDTGRIIDEGLRQYHVDIMNVTLHKLCDLVEAIWYSPDLKIDRKSKSKVKNAIRASVDSNFFRKDQLKSKFQESI